MLTSYQSRRLAYFLIEDPKLFWAATGLHKSQLTEITDSTGPVFPSAAECEQHGLSEKNVQEIRELFALLNVQSERSMASKISECEKKAHGKQRNTIDWYPISISDEDAQTWTRRPTWSLLEAAFYSLGFNYSNELNKNLIKNLRKSPKTNRLFKDLKERIENLQLAQEAGQLDTTNTPYRILEYYDRIGWGIPENLRSAILEFYTKLEDNNNL